MAGFNAEQIMEPRGQNWNEQWPQNQLSDHRVRDEQYRFHYMGKHGQYPPANIRDSERRWYAPDPRYMYYTSGAPPAELAYSSQPYTPDRTRSQSRLVQCGVLTDFFYLCLFYKIHLPICQYSAIHSLAVIHL